MKIKNLIFSAVMGSLFGLLPVSSFAQNSFEMTEPETSDGAPQVIGGVPASKADWPATFSFRSGGGRCTSTVVGEASILTAAHCIEDGAVGSIRSQGVTIRVRCTHHPRYATDYQYDVAMCLADQPIPLANGALFETLNSSSGIPRVNDRVILLGFGCRQEGGGGPSGKLYTGASNVRSLSGVYIVTSGGAAVCFGDSGGGAYASLSDVQRRLIGVNSRGDISTTSYLTSVSSHGVVGFFLDWADENSTTICGLHNGAAGCQP
ncbi:MAG: trypsin-like serine protease [Roseobacter sp.]